MQPEFTRQGVRNLDVAMTRRKLAEQARQQKLAEAKKLDERAHTARKWAAHARREAEACMKTVAECEDEATALQRQADVLRAEAEELR